MTDQPTSSLLDMTVGIVAEPRGVRFRTVTGMSGFRRDGNFASRPIADIFQRSVRRPRRLDRQEPAQRSFVEL